MAFAACDGELEELPAEADAGADVSVGEPDQDAAGPSVDARVPADVVVIEDAPIEDAAADVLDEGLAPPPPFDGGRAFDFAPPYVAKLGPSSRSDAGHNFAANTPPSNPWKTRCIDCHKVGGSAASRPFFAGGSVYLLADGGAATMAEVRLKRTLNANAVSAYTDQDGNWFVPLGAAQDAGVNFSLRPGIRNATLLRTMGPSPAIGVCNQCHGGANYL